MDEWSNGIVLIHLFYTKMYIYDSFFFSQIEIRELINPANC